MSWRDRTYSHTQIIYSNTPKLFKLAEFPFLEGAYLAIKRRYFWVCLVDIVLGRVSGSVGYKVCAFGYQITRPSPKKNHSNEICSAKCVYCYCLSWVLIWFSKRLSHNKRDLSEARHTITGQTSYNVCISNESVQCASLLLSGLYILEWRGDIWTI